MSVYSGTGLTEGVTDVDVDAWETSIDEVVEFEE